MSDTETLTEAVDAFKSYIADETWRKLETKIDDDFGLSAWEAYAYEKGCEVDDLENVVKEEVVSKMNDPQSHKIINDSLSSFSKQYGDSFLDDLATDADTTCRHYAALNQWSYGKHEGNARDYVCEIETVSKQAEREAAACVMPPRPEKVGRVDSHLCGAQTSGGQACRNPVAAGKRTCQHH